MINFFVREDPKVTSKIKKIMKQKLIHKRKYQAFHIDCPTSGKKVCYCVNNPILNVKLEPQKKEQMREKYEKAEQFYRGLKDEEISTASEAFEKAKVQIQALSRKEVASFVKSIKKERNLMGEFVDL